MSCRGCVFPCAQETPGEDIFLSGEYAVQFIHGLQNGSAGSPVSPHYQIIATAKHYLGYDMTGGDTNISDRWAAVLPAAIRKGDQGRRRA